MTGEDRAIVRLALARREMHRRRAEMEAVVARATRDEATPDELAKSVRDASEALEDVREAIRTARPVWQSYRQYLDSDEWRTKAAAAKSRAGNRCQVCNGTTRLDAHHRTYVRLGRELPEDITVLCRTCHELYERNKRAQRDAYDAA